MKNTTTNLVQRLCYGLILIMGKIKNKNSSFKVLDDWSDFDKSKLVSLSSDYYSEKGIDAPFLE